MYATWNPERVLCSIAICYKRYYNEYNWMTILRLFLEISFIREVPSSNTPTFTLPVLLDKHKSMLSSEKISHLSIMSYLWHPCESSIWKFHIIFFVAYISARIVYILVVKIVLNSSLWVPQRTCLECFFATFCMFCLNYQGYRSEI